MLVAESEAEESAYQRGSTEAEGDENDISLNDLLMHVLDTRRLRPAPDVGRPARDPLNGELKQLEDQPILTPPVIQRVLYAALTQKQREKFEENLELDFAYSVPGRARFRVNIYRQRDALGAAFRIIPFEIKQARGPRRAAVGGRTSRRCRAASSSSPARPAPASRRRSRR